VLAQSQRVFIASKPKSIWWYLYFWLSSRQMLWKMLRTIHRRSPFTQSYHWNHPEISVTSVTSSPRLFSTTISGNFSSYDDIVCRSFTPVPVTDRLFISYRWLPSNDVSHRLDWVCTTFRGFLLRDFTTLNNTNCKIISTLYQYQHNWPPFLKFNWLPVSIILVSDEPSNWLFVFQ